jgi:hypothetical protein
MITIPLSKYLKDLSKGWGETFLTKTNGGQLWISDDAPGDISGADEEDKNYIEFDDSGIYMRIPQEIAKLIDIDKGTSKKLNDFLRELKLKVKEG